MASGTLKTIAWAAPLALGIAAGGSIALVRLRLRARHAERRRWLPGDELIDSPDAQNDRGVTIAAPPASVWPWIAQMGQQKAGFYSFELLENLMGCEIEGATRIHPEWQAVAPDDELRLHPELALRIALVESERHLVAASMGGEAPGDPGFDMTWGFYLFETEGPDGFPATRLHIRERYVARHAGARRALRVIGAMSAVMSWRMLARLSKLAREEPSVSR